jgi:ankyrin repeat protein
MRNQTAAVLTLLAAGANPDLATQVRPDRTVMRYHLLNAITAGLQEGDTPLMVASIYGYTAIAQALIARRASLDLQESAVSANPYVQSICPVVLPQLRFTLLPLFCAVTARAHCADAGHRPPAHGHRGDAARGGCQT